MHELLYDCEENIKLLTSQLETHRWVQYLNYSYHFILCQHSRLLGYIVTMDPDRVLRIIAGMVVRDMVANGTAEQELWPADVDAKIYADFPASQGPESQWTEAFIDYTAEWGATNSETQIGFVEVCHS